MTSPATNGAKKANHSKAARACPPIYGYDTAGHMHPARAQHLLELAHENRTVAVEHAFIVASSTDDDLAEELAEAAVTSMTSGQDELSDHLEAEVVEERGGPFTETSGNVEFAAGVDESNIAEATREPFPMTNRQSK